MPSDALAAAKTGIATNRLVSRTVAGFIDFSVEEDASMMRGFALPLAEESLKFP